MLAVASALMLAGVLPAAAEVTLSSSVGEASFSSALVEGPFVGPVLPESDGSVVPVLAAGTQFAPAVIVVPVGTEVAWMSDALMHTVTTSDAQCVTFVQVSGCKANDRFNEDGDPNTFNAAIGGAGDSFSAVFTEPGTYSYYCQFHFVFGMTGQVVVV